HPRSIFRIAQPEIFERTVVERDVSRVALIFETPRGFGVNPRECGKHFFHVPCADEWKTVERPGETYPCIAPFFARMWVTNSRGEYPRCFLNAANKLKALTPVTSASSSRLTARWAFSAM